jgi:large subunit ribosomal protein L21
MKYAIIEDGGKQFKAVEGGTIEVDRYDAEIGDPIGLERVLMVVDGGTVSVGTPVVSGAKVEATVVAQIKGPKVISFKYLPKKRFRLKKGHRQQYTRIRIDSIITE